jgi:ADP-heptose:LPS heptosyltransferase
MSRSPIVVDASVDQLLDMDRFAAQVASLDTVVTISCTAAHLAGALGVPTILLLEEYEAQPWPYAGERSPWYPRLRILRREGREAWADVMRRAAAAIASDELPRR